MMNKVKLGDIADYSDSRIDCSSLSIENYVGTDNIKQNKQGKENSQYAPNSGFTTEYRKNDILVANIRPYLKKIWFATNDGGSSADVLTIRIKDKKYLPRFVYYNLFQDVFFDYAMKGSKGSKMPRGDKKQILDFPICDFELSSQSSIAHVLSSLDDKIELNNKINKELENLARTIYEYWFVQNAEENWERKKIGEIAEVIRGSMITEKQTKNGIIKVVAGGVDYSYCHSEYNRERNTITVSGSGANAGYVNFWRERIFASDCTTVRGKTDFDTILIHQHLKRNQENIFRSAKGSAQPHVYPSDIKDIWFYEFPHNLKKKFTPIFVAINEQIAKQLFQNNNLAQLRDFLLPLLMNGQIIVGEAQDEPIIKPFKKVADDDMKYQIWKTQNGLAARGDIDEHTLRNIYEAIDENDR